MTPPFIPHALSPCVVPVYNAYEIAREDIRPHRTAVVVDMYSPLDEKSSRASSVLGEFGKLPLADDAALLAFVHRYGLPAMGFDVPTNERVDAAPVAWLRAHGRTVRVCLEIEELLRHARAATLRRYLEELPVDGFGVRDCTGVRWQPLKTSAIEPRTQLRWLRAHLVNPHLVDVHPELVVPPEAGSPGSRIYPAARIRERDRLTFRIGGLLQAVYWLLATNAVGGTVRRCACPGCPGLFVQREPRQRYCTAPFGHTGDESPCAIRARNRRRPARVKARSTLARG
jgi:hypothetical protein